MLSSIPIVGDIVKEIGSTVRKAIPDKDQADRLVTQITEVFVKHEGELAKQQGENIRAEANSQSWLARNWRPITMLTFLVLIVAYWFGFTAPGLTEAAVVEVFSLIKIGLGGYVVGRSAEKIAPSVIEALKKR